MVETVRDVPVIVDGRRGVLARRRLARIAHEHKPDENDDGHNRRKKSASLEAHFLAFALLCKSGDLFC